MALPADRLSLSLGSLGWTAFALGAVGTGAGLAALVLQLLDRTRLRITSIRPALSGSGREGGRWHHQVTAIEVLVENKGSRPAIGCRGVITFAHEEALPLHPQTPQHTVDTGTRFFDVQAKSKVRIVGAWNFMSDGAIDGSASTFTPGEFLDRCVPATVVVSLGTKDVRKVFNDAEAKRIFEEHQTQIYLDRP